MAISAPIGAILACAETRTLLLQAMDETVAVGRAENVIVSDGFPAAALHLFAHRPQRRPPDKPGRRRRAHLQR